MSQPAALPKSSRPTAMTLAIFLLGYPLSYLAQVLFSRWLGAEDYGDFSVSISVALLVATLAMLGFDKSALKFLPLYEGPDEAAHAKGFLLYAFRLVISVSLGLSALGWVATRAVESLASVDEHPIRHAMFLVVPMSLSLLLIQMMAGQRRPVMASFFLKVVLPLTLVCIATLVHLISPMSEHAAVGVSAATNSAVAIVLALLLLPGWRKRFQARKSVYEPGEWMAISRSFLMTSFAAVMLAQSGVIVLELVHHDEAAVGIFNAARLTAGYPLVVLTAITMVSIPRLVRQLERGDHETLESELSRSLWTLIAAGVLFLGLWIVWGDAILSLFGLHFETAHVTLVVLGLGHLGVLSLGLAAPILQVRGEKQMIFRSTMALLVANIGLAFLLAPFYGPIGAAAAFTLSALSVGTFQALWLERRLGIPYLRLILRPGSIRR